MTEQLYTTKDITKLRDELYKTQKGIDPIINEKIKYNDTALDHDHTTQHVRAVLHKQSNVFEGKVKGAYYRCLRWLSDTPLPDILRNLADFYDKDYSENPLHTGWIKFLCTKFSGLSEPKKKEVLEYMQRQSGANAAERKKEFKKALMSRSFSFAEIRDLIQEKKG